MSEYYLIDTSALVRFVRGRHAPAWLQAVRSGRVGLREPVRQEYLRAVGRREDFHDAVRALDEAFPHYTLHDRVWQRTAEIRYELGDRSRHGCAGAVDLLVAATAQHHRLTVLHADGGFEAIAKITGQPATRIG